jgi:hypothetical protein
MKPLSKPHNKQVVTGVEEDEEGEYNDMSMINPMIPSMLTTPSQSRTSVDFTLTTRSIREKCARTLKREPGSSLRCTKK